MLQKYKDLLGTKKIDENLSSEMTVEYIRRITKLSGYGVFILIDEYDNFANELITDGKKSTYETILHEEGFVKSFYKAIKDGTNDNFERIFITGVSLIMLDHLTSGFNITENLTTEENLNSVFGFTKNELCYIFDELNIGENERKKLIEDMTFYYNGYKFNKEGESVFNPDMAMYFLTNYLKYKKYPDNMIDLNIKTDYGKINTLVANFKDTSILDEIINAGQTKTKLVEKFDISSMYDNIENFKSLLFYLGMLTIKGAEANNTILGIPNYVIKSIYWEKFYNRINNDVSINSSRISDSILQMPLEAKYLIL